MNRAEDIIHYVQFKDAHKRQLQGMDQHKDRIVFRFSGYTHTYLLTERLDTESITTAKSVHAPDKVTIVLDSTEESLAAVLKQWKDLAALSNTYLLFVDSHRKTQISPYTHSKIADPETLEQGLRTLLNKEEQKE